MPNYSNGKIYKITSGNETYIGSTTLTLNQRLAQHRCNYNKSKEGKRICSNAKIFEYGDYIIELVEDYPCEAKEQLLARERFWIENTNCINITHPLRTDQEYHYDNKDNINERHRIHYHNNIDKERERCKLYYYNNKEKEKERKAQYYQNNKDKVIKRCIEYSKKIENYNCECGAIIKGKTYDKERHFKSKKHVAYCQIINPL